MICSDKRRTPIYIIAIVFPCAIAVTPHQPGESPCNLVIPFLLFESGINTSGIVRCGNLDSSHVLFASQCLSNRGNVIYCTSPILIQHNVSKYGPDILSGEETTSVISDNSSTLQKEIFIECIIHKRGVCMRMFHHTINEVIDEIPMRLDVRFMFSRGIDAISSFSQAHCNSLNIENTVCSWPNETVITQPSNSLMNLLRKYILYTGEKIITSLTIFKNSCKFEYRINLLEPPITDYLKFRSSPVGLISYSLFSNIPLLEDIHIQNITLHHLPPNLFLENTKLRSCTMAHIMLEEVPPDLFKSAVELIKINLSDNRLQTLPEGLFRNNILLRSLILARNRLSYLPTTLLVNNRNLSTLDISHNQLEDLQLVLLINSSETTYVNFTNSRQVPKTFAKRYRAWLKDEAKLLDLFNSTIKTNTFAKIDVSNNRLRRIPNEIFDGSIILTIFRARHNSDITYLAGSHSFYSLQEFSMSDCSINSIDEDFFAKSSDNKPLYVKKIELSRNQLHTLHRATFWNCHELEILLLDKNKLTKLENGLFKDLINLRRLDVSGNMLSAFQPEAFSLQKIEYLDFSWNHIHSFHPQQMISLLESGSGFVKRIDLSHNCLTTKKIRLSSVNISRPLFLKYVSLERKEVDKSRRIDRHRFLVPKYGIKQTSGEQLNYTNIENIGLSLIMQMKIGPIEEGSLLCPNPFKQICNYFPQSCQGITNVLLNTIDEHFRLLGFSLCNEWITKDNSTEDVMKCPFTATCPRNYYKSILYSVAGYYDKDVSFTCPVTLSCPRPCKCYERAIEEEIVVECNHKGLTQLPIDVPPNTSILYFNHNKLQTLKDLNSSMWSNLTKLYLENNSITSIDKIFFPAKLKLISLRNNQLESIDKDSLNILGDIEFFLSGNPWLCDCNTLFLKAKLNAINKISDAKSMLCASLNTSIVNTPNDILCPVKLHISLNISLALYLGIILPLVVAILTLLYYKNKQLVKAYIFTKFPAIFKLFHSSRDIINNKIFDAFVTYSSSDRDVVMQMLEELENKEPRFTLCIHERDWIAGKSISINIAKSVSFSRKTIIILSMDFIQSIWFPIELHTVYYQMLQDKVNRAIIVVRGKIPPVSELDVYLQILLKTKTYLVWGEHWFWEKLRYALFKKSFNGDSLEDRRPTSDFIEKIEADILNAEHNKSKSNTNPSINEFIA